MEFKHPKYYKELRKRNKLDQVISKSSHDGESERAPGPGLKQQAIEETVPHNDIEEASSSKHQASSQTKTSLSSETLKQQAASVKS